MYGKKADDPRKRQALLLGWREVEFLTAHLIELLRSSPTDASASADVADWFEGKDTKSNLTAMRTTAGALSSGLEAALFGRMVTSDPAANTDAAIHVAHAFTVHEQESETDYFTVVDDLKLLDVDADSGSAGIFDTELTSGVFYGYVVIDVPLLVANITGAAPTAWSDTELDRSLPATVVQHLIHLIATVSPGAKKGSTAPYSFASTMLVEAGERQPRSLASAFERPLRAAREMSVSQTAEAAMLDRLQKVDRAYGANEARRYLSTDSEQAPGLGDAVTLDALAEWVAGVVRNAAF